MPPRKKVGVEYTKILVRKIARQRNGLDGKPYHAVIFIADKGKRLVASVFPEEGNVAVLPSDLRFFEIDLKPNLYRGKGYEPQLRVAIAEWERERFIEEIESDEIG